MKLAQTIATYIIGSVGVLFLLLAAASFGVCYCLLMAISWLSDKKGTWS